MINIKIKSIIINLLLISSIAVGQIPSANTVVTNNHINKFEGIWTWVSANDTVMLKLKKGTFKYSKPANSYEEVLFGCHSYIKNGLLIETSLDKFDSVVNFNSYQLATFFLYPSASLDTSTLVGSISDITRKKHLKGKLEYLTGSPVRIRLTIFEDRNIRYTYPGNTRQFFSGITLPIDIILLKQ